jgi:translation elongation factor EF-G
MIVDRLAARPIPVLIPFGEAETYRGGIDVVAMKAIVWNDDALGAEYAVVDIPEDMLAVAREATTAWSKRPARSTTRCSNGSSPAGRSHPTIYTRHSARVPAR